MDGLTCDFRSHVCKSLVFVSRLLPNLCPVFFSHIIVDFNWHSFAVESIGAVLLPAGAALSQLPFVHLTAEEVRRASHGREVRVAETSWNDGEDVRMCDADNELIAVGRYDANTKSLHPRVVLASL